MEQMVLQGHPSPTLKDVDPRSPLPVLVSARTEKSLIENLERLSNYLEANPGTDLADLANTTGARRMHHIYRRAFAVKDISEARNLLNKDILDTKERTVQPTFDSIRTVFLFSGQGTHYLGMGAGLFRFCRVFREKILECERLALELGFSSFIQMIDGTLLAEDAVFSPLQTQLAVVSLEISIAALWQSWGIYPNLILGLSLGEYAALHVSNVISLASTLYLVGERAKLMLEFCVPDSYSMLVAQATMQEMQHYLEQSGALCEVSSVNSPQMIVISGPCDQIATLHKFLGARPIRSTILKLPFAFHSSQMDPILGKFEALAAGVHYASPTIPLISTATGSMVQHDKIIWSNYLTRQTREPVFMQAAVSACIEHGGNDESTIWIECGPSAAYVRLLKATMGTSTVTLLPTLDPPQTDLSTISQSVSRAYEIGLDISWPDFHSDYQDCHCVLELPHDSSDLEDQEI